MKTPRPTEPIMQFGERIRTLRQEQGLTQQAVADRLQIHRTTYTKYEQGCVAPDQQGLLRLSEIFGVTVDALLGRPETLAVEDGTVRAVDLSEEERVLVQLFRQLTAEEQREMVTKVQTAFRAYRKK